MGGKIEVLVLSMESAHERRARISDVLAERADIDWRFFDAFSAESHVPGLLNAPDLQLRHFGRVLTRAEVGCFKSHYAILSALAKTADGWLLVMEDDVWIDPEFSISEVIQFCESKGYNYCRLFAKAYKPASIVGWLSGFRQVIRFRTDPYGAQAYLINPAGARRFISATLVIDRPIDDQIGRFWRHGLLPVSVFPFPCVEKAVISSIDHGRNTGNKTRRKWDLRLLVHRIDEKIRKEAMNLSLTFRA